MSFKEEVLNSYLDEEGLVSIDKNPSKWSTGNGLLYTGIFYSLLALDNKLTAEDIARFAVAVNRCWLDRYGFTYEGLLERNDKREDLEAHDDYIGICAASYLLKTDHAKKIVEYGKQNFWSYNNVEPGRFVLRTWHGRFFGLIGFYKMAANEDPGWLQRKLLKYSITGAAAKNDNSGELILMWLKTLVARQYSDEYKMEVGFWKSAITARFGSLTNLFSKYFGSNHPFSKYEEFNAYL
jgi:hypothetical protein